MAEDPKFVVHGSQVQKWTDDIQKIKQELDSFRKQRDELINDMAEVKRKAEILDKLEEMFETSANANRKHGFNGAAKVYERYLDIIRERGSDVES